MTRRTRAKPHVGEGANGRNDGKDDEQPERRQLDMNIGVASADDNAVVVVEQEVAIQSVSPGLDREKEAEQRGAMGDCRG